MKQHTGRWAVEAEHIYEAFKIFTLKRSRRTNPRTGKPFDFFLMEGLSWVNVVPLTPAGDVVVVRQYRHGTEEYTLELPGGCIETDEHDPAIAAVRELSEETGYSTERITPLGVIAPNPAMMSMRLHTFLAHGCRPVAPQRLDPGEDITIVVKPLAECFELIRTGEINHALVVAAFGLLTLHHPALLTGANERKM
jgi:ADP-ribose pyrophosphatase